MPQSSSCIDLIFTDQPKLIVDTGVHPSLHSNCHHQINYYKLNLNVKYLPPYERLVWDYNKENVRSVKKSIESVNWELMFSNMSVHKQVSIFDETLINIFSNFTPNKPVTFDDRDPPWMNDFVKSKIKWKSQLFNTYAKNGYKFNDHLHLQEVTTLVSKVIATSAKTYWSKSFL